MGVPNGWWERNSLKVHPSSSHGNSVSRQNSRLPESKKRLSGTNEWDSQLEHSPLWIVLMFLVEDLVLSARVGGTGLYLPWMMSAERDLLFLNMPLLHSSIRHHRHSSRVNIIIYCASHLHASPSNITRLVLILVLTSFLSFWYAFVIPFCLFSTMCISVTIKY